MRTLSSESFDIRSSEDIVAVRQAVRKQAVAIGFGLIDQTKFVTAASELARNTLDHGGGGKARVEIVENGIKPGIRLTFDDSGPGIADLGLAMRDGYTSGNGMGLGLSGAKRLSHEFEIKSEVGVGTTVSILRWK
ncbi:MAG TPA: anti-sigma regulatory factor [Bryobacteraceae bacterium]|jgi:serine/threonine-protein kinase RsbT|nr:anti-sigma regulatory factor [Bryobacteraceae bacterium]